MAAEENINKETTKAPKDNKIDPLRSLRGPAKKDGKPKFNFYWIYTLIALIFISFFFFNTDTPQKEINWGELREMLKEQDVEKIVLVNREFAEIYIKQDRINKIGRAHV